MTSKMNIECDICCELINKSKHKQITCPIDICKFMCCRICFVYHLMNSGINPCCIKCKKDFSSDFLEENLTQKEYKEYINHTTELRLEIIKEQLPEWQEDANIILRNRKLIIEENKIMSLLRNINDDIYEVKKLLFDIYTIFFKTKRNQFSKNHFNYINWSRWIQNQLIICSVCDKEDTLNICECGFKKCKMCTNFCLLLNDTKCILCNKEQFTIDEIKYMTSISFFNNFFKPKKRIQNSSEMLEHKNEAISLIKNKIKLNENYNTHIYGLYNIKYGNDSVYTEKIVKKEVGFLKKCPDSNCRGFLSSAWKCGLCEEFFCYMCHAKKKCRDDTEHICDENEKATVAMLKKETKPCPKCGMPIDRYTGCTQVWTPCCKIAFYWDTMKLVTNERIHSPEYYDYIRRTNNGIVPRENGDDPCGGRISFYTVNNALRGEPLKDKCIEYFRLTEHVNAVQLAELPNEIGRIDNSDLCIKYLTGDIDDEKWKYLLKKKIKKDKRENEVYHILRMFINVMDDLLHLLVHERKTDKFIENVNELIIYTNGHIEKINQKYKSVEKKYFVKITL